jgi:imidazolonepropionase-like amidohydrolase
MSTSEDPVTTRIDAEQLIPGRGDPVRDGTVVIEGFVITYAGPRDQAPDTPDATVVSAATVMPGLWDCHGHFLGMRSADMASVVREPLALRAARAGRDLALALDAGFTSIREAGGLGVHLARAVEEGSLPGPSIYAPGSILSTTGGHADLHDLPLEWVVDLAQRDDFGRLADGVDECVRATREQLRKNAKVIKVCASGGVLSEVDDPIHQQFSDAELRAIVETAAMSDRVVMAHCHGRPGIVAALDAGVASIEHGTYLDPEICDRMAAAGTVLVPTRYIIHQLLVAGKEQHVPPVQMRKLEIVADAHATAVSLAHERGVTIALGTDIFQSGEDLPVGWGQNGRELGLMVDLGLSPLEAIETATANGPLTLGPQAPRSGQLLADHDADVIVVDGDPLADIDLLGDPSRITGVWKRGVRVKG